MADDIDVANDLIANEISRALKEIRQQAGQVIQGPKLCVDCGDDMPLERQKLGFKRCMPCASDAERRRSLFAEE